MPQTLEEPKHPIEITSDLTTVKFLIREIVKAMNEGPKSRERSLVITKLEEAEMWALSAQSKE